MLKQKESEELRVNYFCMYCMLSQLIDNPSVYEWTESNKQRNNVRSHIVLHFKRKDKTSEQS